MDTDYSKTPSYFNNCEYFNKYLGKTSYYSALQDALCTLITRVKPERVLELGCALGTTTFMLADKFPDIEFSGLDLRPDIVTKTNKQQENRDIMGKENAAFIRADMLEFAKSDELSGYDFVFMLYSFHHIEDPQDKKVQFLRDMNQNMSKGAYLWIGETFLPDDGTTIEELWTRRANEGYASTFWNSLKDYPRMPRETAYEAAETSYDEEYKAGKFVNNRDDEYLVTRKWAGQAVRDAGFEVVINEPVNAFEDGVIFVKKA